MKLRWLLASGVKIKAPHPTKKGLPLEVTITKSDLWKLVKLTKPERYTYLTKLFDYNVTLLYQNIRLKKFSDKELKDAFENYIRQANKAIEEYAEET